MPKIIVGRRKHCIKVMHRDSPFISPKNSNDEEDEVADISRREKAEQDIAEVLLGMGKGCRRITMQSRRGRRAKLMLGTTWRCE